MSTAVDQFYELEDLYNERVSGLVFVDEPVYELGVMDPYTDGRLSYVSQDFEEFGGCPSGVSHLRGMVGVPAHIGRLKHCN